MLLNKESSRETPSVVTFTAKQRHAGTDAVGALSSNPSNTVYQLKRLLGKAFKDPAVQADLATLPYKVTEGPHGECLLEVQYLGKTARISAEAAMAALLVDLREQAEREQGAPVVDAVITAPVYWAERERHAMLAAAHVAGLNCLRLLDETTATALAYGIYKTDLPEANPPLRVAFVDVGHASTQVCVAALRKGQVEVLANAWDRDLGGRDFDRVLFDHFATEFEGKYKVDVRKNHRAAFRLLRACERTKRVLTTNSEAPINVESLGPEVDAAGMISREAFEAGAAPILSRLLAPVRRAVEDAGLAPADITAVEVVGGCTRVPAVLKLLADFFGREPSRTLNSKETPARGAALACAMLSPAFKVREFQVRDACPYGVQFSWEREGEAVTSVVFERGSSVPSAKMLTFFRAAPFEVEAAYTPESALPEGADRRIGSWKVGPFTVPKGQEKAKIKVKVVLNLNGVVEVESAHVVEEIEEAAAPAAEEPAAAAAAAAPTADEAPADGGAAPEAAAPEAGGDAPAPAADAAAAAAPKKKVKTRKTSVPVAASTGALAPARVAALYEAECEMALQARVQAETADSRNAVEAYVLRLRSRLQGGDLAAFEKDDKRAAAVKALDAAEEWLYDEGEDAAKTAYTAKLAELKALGAGPEARAAEVEARPKAAAALRAAAQRFLAAAEAPAAAHLAPGERARVAEEARGALAWLAEKEAAAKGQAKWEEPLLRAADVDRRRESVAAVAEPILAKPAPKPEPPAPAAAAPAAGGEEAMDADEAGPPPLAEGDDTMEG